jgi:pimeloyl-ACP methyl ester carboxylesterase
MVQPFPPGMRVEEIEADGATIHTRIGRQGPAVVMLHGFGDTDDMWAPLASALVDTRTVVCPTCAAWACRPIPSAATTRKRRATTWRASSTGSGSTRPSWSPTTSATWWATPSPRSIRRRSRAGSSWTRRCSLPGIGPWDEILKSPVLCHFNFRGPDVERLVQGRERIYLDRFWNELSANPKSIDEETRRHYAGLYARPGAMHLAFEQFAAFTQDATDNNAFAAKGKLSMPVLAIGADKSFGTAMADVLRFVAGDVTGHVVANSGHRLMEEQPAATVAAITAFFAK